MSNKKVNEAQEALLSLKEGNGVQVNDTHEDQKVKFDKSDLIKAPRLSYKSEYKVLKDNFIKNLAIIDSNETQELSFNGISSENILSIKKKYAEQRDKLTSEFNKTNDELKEKYADEIKYKIDPRIKRKEELLNSDVLLSVRNLKQFFFFGSKLHNQKLKAVSNVSFDVHKGECFGIVGESGCGKTTTGRTIIKLYNPTSGSVYYRGYRIGAGERWNQKEIKWSKVRTKKQIAQLKKDAAKAIRSLKRSSATYANDVLEIKNKLAADIRNAELHLESVIKTQKDKIKSIRFDQKHTPKKLMSEIQMIFQDPVDSLDPRMTVEDIIQEGLIIQGHRNKKENHKKVVEMLEKVGLVEEHASRYPHEFSGGQRQRIGIARALIMNPKLLICDEPISALDVSIRAQVINLLNDLKEEMGLTLIFIAHDLSVVKYFCDRIAVMYFGKIVECASSDELFRHPLHPYTISLLSAIPKPNPLTERHRTRIIYKPQEVHDYSTDKPTQREVCPGHTVYCNEKEFKEYQAKIAEIDSKTETKKTAKKAKVSK